MSNIFCVIITEYLQLQHLLFYLIAFQINNNTDLFNYNFFKRYTYIKFFLAQTLIIQSNETNLKNFIDIDRLFLRKFIQFIVLSHLFYF